MLVTTRAQWGARYPKPGPATTPATEVWLHHDTTPASRVPLDVAGEHSHIRSLEQTGHERFGGTISYTFVVFPSGRVYEGHGAATEGTHTFGHNGVGRGIVVVGDYQAAAVPLAAEIAVAELLVHGVAQRWWRAAALTGGHRDVRATECPGDRLYARITWINRRAAAFAVRPLDDGDDDMRTLVKLADTAPVFLTNGVTRRWVRTRDELEELVRAGIVEDRTVKVLSKKTLSAIVLVGPAPG